MNRFEVHRTRLKDLVVIQRQVIGDERGFLARLFCAEQLTSAGWTWPISQINHTATAVCGTVRGMHYQVPPKAEAKLVSCIRGAVWDVAVDIRHGSPTFLQWHAEELSAENLRAMLIPPGFAHGFLTLSEHAEVLYKTTDFWSKDCEGAIRWDDPQLAIHWPLDLIGGMEPLLAQKDGKAPLMAEAVASGELFA